jgi:hypothetical protein
VSLTSSAELSSVVLTEPPVAKFRCEGQIRLGLVLDDHSSKQDRGGDGGANSDRRGAHDDLAARANDADEILRLFNARMGIEKPSSPSQAPRPLPSSIESNAKGVARHLEMTPTPMVVGVSAPATLSGHSHARAPNDSDHEAEAFDIGDASRRDSSGYVAYHAPRTPPTSVAPPPAESTFSVAPEYDPKAPTKPRVRRNTSVPPAPLLFGMDRMLVWGLVLGGTFVAAIVVLVHRLTSLDARPQERGATDLSPPPMQGDASSRVAEPLPPATAPASATPRPSPPGTSEIKTGSPAEPKPPQPRPRSEKSRPKQGAEKPADAGRTKGPVPWIE